MAETYRIRKTFVVYEHPQYGLLRELVRQARIARDKSGQMWVSCGRVCCKVQRAKPYTADWMDKL